MRVCPPINSQQGMIGDSRTEYFFWKALLVAYSDFHFSFVLRASLLDPYAYIHTIRFFWVALSYSYSDTHTPHPFPRVAFIIKYHNRHTLLAQNTSNPNKKTSESRINDSAFACLNLIKTIILKCRDLHNVLH